MIDTTIQVMQRLAEKEIDVLLDELEELRTPTDRWGKKYLGTAIKDQERIREIRKRLAEYKVK